MLRSEINAAIERAKSATEATTVSICRAFAFWTPEHRKSKGAECDETGDCKLGWDITDFGAGRLRASRARRLHASQRTFDAPALSLAPLLRKSNDRRRGAANADAQTPVKQEDIIFRAGGDLAIEVYRVGADGRLGREDVALVLDCVSQRVLAGHRFVLEPGQSIQLTPDVFHEFYAGPAAGRRSSARSRRRTATSATISSSTPRHGSRRSSRTQNRRISCATNTEARLRRPAPRPRITYRCQLATSSRSTPGGTAVKAAVYDDQGRECAVAGKTMAPLRPANGPYGARPAGDVGGGLRDRSARARRGGRRAVVDRRSRPHRIRQRALSPGSRTAPRSETASSRRICGRRRSSRAGARTAGKPA